MLDRTPSQLKLEQLPHDVLVLLFGAMSFGDAMRLKKTCRFFYSLIASEMPLNKVMSRYPMVAQKHIDYMNSIIVPLKNDIHIYRWSSKQVKRNIFKYSHKLFRLKDAAVNPVNHIWFIIMVSVAVGVAQHINLMSANIACYLIIAMSILHQCLHFSSLRHKNLITHNRIASLYYNNIILTGALILFSYVLGRRSLISDGSLYSLPHFAGATLLAPLAAPMLAKHYFEVMLDNSRSLKKEYRAGFWKTKGNIAKLESKIDYAKTAFNMK